MPTYEFRCETCGRASRLFFTYAEYDDATPQCAHCGSMQLRRRIGRITIAKSEDARMDALLDDPMLDSIDEDDPRALGRFMRKMSAETGEDLGEEFGEVVDRLEKGQSPEEIEKAMPDLADEGAGGFGGMDDF
ncbi:MAG: zinc ribbon domain-containing protein [Anaerolineae bacterium]|nr:zinc ribbon domain-containing protein [Anaerolineae bacterium]MCO5207052.1 zinc ribbon domain-containing protein [Anaerolineae bacterium]